MKEKNTVPCNLIEKMIPKYLNKELKDRDKYELLTHVAGCASCREELSIQYFVHAGFETEGDELKDFNLPRALSKKIETDREKLLSRGQVRTGIYMLGISGIMTAVYVIMLIFF